MLEPAGVVAICYGQSASGVPPPVLVGRAVQFLVVGAPSVGRVSVLTAWQPPSSRSGGRE